MKKLTSILISALAVVLFSSNLSYAAPTKKIISPTSETLPTRLTPQLITQAVAELKKAGIHHKTINNADGLKTTFYFDQDFSFTFVKPKPTVSTFLWGGWDEEGAYILLTRSDIHVLMNGSGGLIARGICLLPGMGWAACLTANIVVDRIVAWIKNNNPYRCGNRQMKMYFGGRPGGCA